MNVYRSFGCLLENWIAEGSLDLDSGWLGNSDEVSPTSFSDMDTTLNCESVDSGVETAGSVMSLPITCGSVSMDNTELDAMAADTELDRSPVLYDPSSASCPSLNLLPNTPQETSTALHLKLEQALQRTQPRRVWNGPECKAEGLEPPRRNRASWYLKRHISSVAKGQRSENLRMAKTASPVTSIRKISEPRRRPLSMRYEQRPFVEKLEPLGEEEREGLSPGFRYLEQVCQTLERIAKHQLHNRAIQMKIDALREHQDELVSQAPDNCQCDVMQAEGELAAHPRLSDEGIQHFSSETLQRKDYPSCPMRQRSASDTTIATIHSRKFRPDTRGPQTSIDDLMNNDGARNSQLSKREEGSKGYKNWRGRLATLRRGETVRTESKSQQPSSEKITTRRRLSNLIRKRLKTT
ncbi:uncharacterized protein LOC143011322 [Genypterus blacodes]|uniref:uncharacterized protein LOC143011322 n=1 Tax=Genypterus blacodes TaxID=154954 RepID=UPI003F75C1E0